MLRADQILAQACHLEDPTKHKNSPLRSAGDANAVELLNNMGLLDSEKRAPRYLVPSDELGSVTFGSLSTRDEVSVSARLESLEESMRKVCSVLEKVQANPPVAVTSRLSGLEENLKKVLDLGMASNADPTFASVVANKNLVMFSMARMEQEHREQVWDLKPE